MAPVTMTRAQAIGHLMGLSFSVDMQMCVGPRESAALEAETRAALHLLGVTDEEIDADEEPTERPCRCGAPEREGRFTHRLDAPCIKH